jgi:hypothetical protein
MSRQILYIKLASSMFRLHCRLQDTAVGSQPYLLAERMKQSRDESNNLLQFCLEDGGNRFFQNTKTLVTVY